MYSLVVATALLAAQILAAPAGFSGTCATGAFIITARGSYTNGQLGLNTLVNASMTAIPGSINLMVDYPANFFPSYQASEEKGVQSATALITQVVDACPDSRLILLGYSQGAQVVLDSICGCSDNAFPYTDPLPAAYASHVSVVVLYGDPSHVPNQPWDRGTATKQGSYARQKNDQCSPFAGKMASYCDKNDLYCAGGLSLAVHKSYPQRYDKDASQFIVDTWNQQYGTR